MSVPSMSKNTAFTKVILLVRLGTIYRAEKLCRERCPLGWRPRYLARSFQRGSFSALARDGALGKRCATGDAQNLAAYVARLLGGQEDVGWRQLGRLGRASHGGLRGAELRDLLGGHGGRDQRRPHRPRCHRVDPDAPPYKVLRKPLGEGDDGALGGGVVQEPRLGLVGLDRGGIDDARAGAHVRYRRLGEPEHRVEVGFQDAVELLGCDVGYAARLHHLVSGVVDEDVYPPKLLHGLLHETLAVGLVPNVAGYPKRLPAGLLYHSRRLLSVRL